MSTEHELPLEEPLEGKHGNTEDKQQAVSRIKRFSDALPNSVKGFFRRFSRLILWLFCIPLIGSIPFIVSWYLHLVYGGDFSLTEVLSHGEGLILSIALIGHLIHELSLKRKGSDLSTKLFYLACIFVIAGSLIAFVPAVQQDIKVTGAIVDIQQTARQYKVPIIDLKPGDMVALKPAVIELLDTFNKGVVAIASWAAFLSALGLNVFFIMAEE